MDAAGVVTTLVSFKAFDHGSQPLGRLGDNRRKDPISWTDNAAVADTSNAIFRIQ